MIQRDDPASATRCLAVWLTATAALLGIWWWLWPDLVGPGGGSLQEALARGAAVTAALCAAWGWAATTATTITAVLGRPRTRVPGCPIGLQRAVLAACGVAVVAGLGAPAHAHGEGRPGGASIVEGLPLPDRPLSMRAPSPQVAAGPRVSSPTTGSPGPAHVVVAPGDTLWHLARERLPDGAGDITVAEAWQRIYAANRAVIGTDPDLIRPGQRLRIPAWGEAR